MTADRNPPQLLPSAVDILRCVREVTHDLIAPTLAGHSERSAAATIDHMLRYTEGLIAHQGQALLDEEARLRQILPDIADWVSDRDARLSQAMLEDCARTFDPTVYPTLMMMENRVAVLRQHVCDVLEILHAAGEQRSAKDEAVYQDLRDYMRWQVAREGEIVEPAFLGHGPRR